MVDERGNEIVRLRQRCKRVEVALRPFAEAYSDQGDSQTWKIPDVAKFTEAARALTGLDDEVA